MTAIAIDRAPIFAELKALLQRRQVSATLLQVDVVRMDRAIDEAIGVATPPGLQDPSAFFGVIRDCGLFDPLRQSQVDGLNRLLSAFALARWPVAFAAYGLATPYHEGDRAMQPIKERGGHKYLDKYDTGRLALILGNTPEDDDDGQLYCGRGDVMITGLRNYQWGSKVTGFDLVKNPELALDPAISATLLVEGLESGAYTGRKLADYLPSPGPATRKQFREARRCVNGTDRADRIAGYAVSFQTALVAGGWR